MSYIFALVYIQLLAAICNVLWYVCVCNNRWLCLFQCFAVRSLGWVEMAEEDLAPGKSSVAVNNCIRQLSYCKNDIRDTVGIWGEVRCTLAHSLYYTHKHTNIIL